MSDKAILKRLEDEKIFEVEIMDANRSVRIRECCDVYFYDLLNKSEFGKLIQELTEIHSKLKD